MIKNEIVPDEVKSSIMQNLRRLDRLWFIAQEGGLRVIKRTKHEVSAKGDIDYEVSWDVQFDSPIETPIGRIIAAAVAEIDKYRTIAKWLAVAMILETIATILWILIK